MACSSCGADNRPGRKFCTHCGASLAQACPTCSSPLEGGGILRRMRRAPISASALLTAGRTSLWLGDPQRVGVVVEQLTGAHVHGAWLDDARRGLEAGLAVLDGRLEESATLSIRATKSLRDLFEGLRAKPFLERLEAVLDAT